MAALEEEVEGDEDEDLIDMDPELSEAMGQLSQEERKQIMEVLRRDTVVKLYNQLKVR